MSTRQDQPIRRRNFLKATAEGTARRGPFQPVRPEKARKQGRSTGGALYNGRTRSGGVVGRGGLGNLG